MSSTTPDSSKSDLSPPKESSLERGIQSIKTQYKSAIACFFLLSLINLLVVTMVKNDKQESYEITLWVSGGISALLFIAFLTAYNYIPELKDNLEDFTEREKKLEKIINKQASEIKYLNPLAADQQAIERTRSTGGQIIYSPQFRRGSK